MPDRTRASLVWIVLLAASAQAGAATPAYFPADAKRGATLAAPCLTCHGPSDMRLGSPPVHPPKLVGERPDALYLALLAYQRGARRNEIMQAVVAALSLQDMRDLAAYLAAEGPKRPPTPASTDSWAHEKVHRDCTACHGETGMGEMWGIPVLTGQYRDYLVSALMAYRDGARHNDTMGPIAGRLTPQEIEQLADYFAQQMHLRAGR
jgi:cytochrome c553